MSWLKIAVSGSDVEFDRGYFSSAVTASIFSGSHQGNGSALTNILSSSYAATASYVQSQLATKTICLTIDGGGIPITTGIKGDVIVPFNCTINEWYIVADQIGSIVIDVWKSTFAAFPPTVLNTITGVEKPTLVAAQTNSDTSLTTWTTSVSSGDVLRFNVDSISAITRINLVIKATA